MAAGTATQRGLVATGATLVRATGLSLDAATRVNLRGPAHAEALRAFPSGGNDVLTGGTSRDVFLFRAGYGSDRITDFEDDLDRIRIDDNPWAGTLTAAQVVAQFRTIVGTSAMFSFGGGNLLTVNGVTDAGVLVNDIVLV